MPAGLEDAEYPIIGLIGDYKLSLNQMLPVMGVFDYFFCDSKGKRLFNKLGFDNCDFFCLYGYDPKEHKDYGLEKDFDVVFIGNLSASIQQERQEYTYPLAKLDRKYNIFITSGVFGSDYVRLLNRSHLVFNRSIRDEANMRFFEALGCGCVVMNNRLEELSILGFVPNEHYLEYDCLAEAVNRYFEVWSEDERKNIRTNGAHISKEHTYDMRASRLIRQISCLELNISARKMARLSEKEKAKRWHLYMTNDIELSGLGLLNR